MAEAEQVATAGAAGDKLACMDSGSDCVVIRKQLGRKRVVSSDKNPAKKKCCCCGDEASLSRLEALPEELLIRAMCRVDHEDLDQLLQVSNTIRQAALVAKRLHFAYSTPPRQSSPAFRNSISLEDDQSLAGANDGDEIVELEPPKMKLKRTVRPRRFDGTKMAALAVALFTD